MLSGLFSLDALAGGFVVQSYLAFWFAERFGADPAAVGAAVRRQQRAGRALVPGGGLAGAAASG